MNKKRMGIMAKKPDYTVVVRYSDNAIKKDLIKFIPKKGKPFEVQLGEMVDLLSKFVSQDILAPTMMDNKIINMIKVRRALQFIPNKDIKAGELVNIPFEHMMPAEYAIAEEALGVAIIPDKVKAINRKQLELANKRVKQSVIDFTKALHEPMLKKEENNQDET